MAAETSNKEYAHVANATTSLLDETKTSADGQTDWQTQQLHRTPKSLTVINPKTQ